jgi:LmbE family N-acetylglucosaminyl deacetylase
MRKSIFALSLLSLLMVSATMTETMAQGRIEQWTGKTVMVFTPHPDDDLYGAGGLMALLAKNKNRVIVVVYTNGNKGSLDLEMTSERLARIRKGEEESALKLLGVPKENVIWLGYDDGELEYVPAQLLARETTRLIRKYRPDAVISIDPGENYERWHKTDHRMAAFNTLDAARAADYHLYFPEHLLVEDLKPYKVPVYLFYYSSAQETNYWVNIDSVIELKLEALGKAVSQFPPSANKYRADWDAADYRKFIEQNRAKVAKKDGHYVEPFRLSEAFREQ